MWSTRCYRALLVFGLLILFCCVPKSGYKLSEEEPPHKNQKITETRPFEDEETSITKGSRNTSRPDDEKPVPLNNLSDKSISSKETITPPQQLSKTAYQESIDSALDLCQAANDYWERGDLDQALDALDKAYSLILEVEIEDDLELSQQIEDLRFTISKRIVEIYASRFTVVNGSHKAIPLVMNRHVKHELDSFKGKDRNFFIKTYRRSGRYRPAMVRALKAAGLPKELSWLPLIESGFRVRAFSRARALGLWQFIASTGYRYGLKRDAYIDERMDPEKSTDAAIAYLKELHHMFGDWTTALAAYNCGERTVLNGIRSQRVNYLDNFWDLYEKLPRETAAYVPRFLAVLHILNDPEAHDVSLPPVDEEIRVEEVTISKQLHLKTIARCLDIDYALLKNINAELRQDLTPNEPYSLKLPYGKGELLLSKLNDIPVWQPPVPAYSVHKVQNGESLSHIAEKYKTSVKAIMAMNGLKRKDYLLVGWRLRIPAKGSTAVARLIRPPSQSKKLKGDMVTYVVKKGDSLWQIARKFGTTTKIIQSINQIKNPHLMIGQVLKIPVGLMGSGTYKSQPYRVKKGDSPSLIAKKCRMNLSQFLKLNRLTPRSTIFPGQILRVMAK